MNTHPVVFQLARQENGKKPAAPTIADLIANLAGQIRRNLGNFGQAEDIAPIQCLAKRN